MTYMQAALKTLTYADRPLTVSEITAVAVAQGLVRPRGRTPDRTMASVLYRRLAADPDAPIVCRTGRFWLRERALPEAEASYLSRRARRARAAAHRVARDSGAGPRKTRRASQLPTPPLRLPEDVVPAFAAEMSRPAPDYAPTRRERAVARAGERGARLLARLASRRPAEDLWSTWDVARTDARLVRPVLAHLGYHVGGGLAPAAPAGRGALSYTLDAAGAPVVALHVRRLAHDLDDDDAWRALADARRVGAPYAGVTNGRALRVYAVSVAAARDDVSVAHMLALDLAPDLAGTRDDPARAAALWLLSRAAVADGALDAYTTDRIVGAALLDAFDAPDGPLSRALVADVRARLGRVVPARIVLRHARLALRGPRGRDGEPLPADIAAVAAVRGPRAEPSPHESARSA